MASCKHCGGPRIETRALADKDLADLGIPVRVAEGAHVSLCGDCGREEVFVESMGDLLLAASMTLAFVPYKLNSQEIKFCRKTLGLSGKSLASLMSVQPETVSRWENDKQPINDAVEKIFRMNVVDMLKDRVPHSLNLGLGCILALDLSPVRRREDIPTLVYGEYQDVPLEGDPHGSQKGYRPRLVANS